MILIILHIFIPGIVFCIYTILDAYNYIKEGHDYDD